MKIYNRFKYIVILIIITLTFPLFTVKVSYVKAEEPSKLQSSLLLAIGITDDKLDADKIVTRGALAKYIGRLKGIGMSIPFALETYFSDVDKYEDYAAYINTLAKEGLIKGLGDNIYEPNRPARLNEAVKIILDIAGYRYRAERNGGYPGGYLTTAIQIGLLKGVPTSDEYCYGDALITLLYNSLDIEMYLLTGVTTDRENTDPNYVYKKQDGRTLLYEFHRMKKDNGIIRGNKSVKLTEASYGTSQVVIGNKIFDSEIDVPDEFVGLNAVYVFKEESDLTSLIFVYPEQNNIFEITAENFIDIDGLTIYYNEGQFEKKKSFTSVSDILFNGSKVDYSEDVFKGISTGSITLIDNNKDNKYEVVKIESYSNLIIGTINLQNNYIYDLREEREGVSFEDCENINIINQNGNQLSISDLKDNMVLTYYINQGYLKGFVSDMIIEGSYKGTTDIDNMTCYVIDDKEYPLSMSFSENERRFGKVRVYLNYQGKIVHIIDVKQDELKIGVLIEAKFIRNGLDDELVFKIFELDGKTSLYKCAARVTYDGERKKSEELPTDWNQGIIAYTLSDKNEINFIQVPRSKETYKEGELFISYPKKSSYHYAGNRMFDGKIIYDGNTKFFKVPLSNVELTEDNISLMTSSEFRERTNYYIEAYNFSKDDMVANVIVNYNDEGASTAWTATKPLGVISKIYTKYTEEKGTIQAADIYVNGLLYTYYITNEFADKLYEDEEIVLQVGDVIKFTYNLENDINFAEVLYRVDEGWIPFNAYYGNSNLISDSLRIVYGTVIRKEGNFIRYMLGEATSDFITDCYATPFLRYAGATIIQKTAFGVIIKRGSGRDAEKGDRIIEHTSSQTPVSLIIIKGENTCQ